MKKPQKPETDPQKPRTSPRFALELDGMRAAEAWLDEEGRLYARSFTSNVTVCIELLGTVHLGEVVGDEFQPRVTFAAPVYHEDKKNGEPN